MNVFRMTMETGKIVKPDIMIYIWIYENASTDMDRHNVLFLKKKPN